MQPSNRGSAPALEKGLRILELIARSPHGRTLADVHRVTGLPKSSTFCLLATLERCGYVHRHSRTRRYMFGFKNLSLANEGLASIEISESAMPHLSALVHRTNLTAHLMVFAFNSAMVVGKVDPPGFIRLATWVGKRMDLHCTGGGKALLAYLPEEEIDRLVRECGLPRHNENTIRSVRRLKTVLATARRCGYAVDDEEDELGFRCVGSAILNGAGTPTAAVSISGTTQQIDGQNLTELAAEVKATAQAIAASSSRN